MDGNYDQQEVLVAVTYVPRGVAVEENLTENLVVRNSTTVGELKTIIQRDHSLHIPAHSQVLLHVTSRILIHDNERLDSLAEELEEGQVDEIFVFRKIEPRDVPIRVKIDPAIIHKYTELPDGHEMEFTVPTQLLVSDLKKMIDAEIGLPPRRQQLGFFKRELRDNLQLDVFITELNDLKLTVYEKPRNIAFVFDLPLELANGRMKHIPMELHDTIYTLRGIIRRNGFLFQPQGKFALYERFDNDEEELPGDRTFAELDIIGDSVVFIEEEGGTVIDP